VEATHQAETPDAKDDEHDARPGDRHHPEQDDDDTPNGEDPPIARDEVEHEVLFLHWNAMSRYGVILDPSRMRRRHPIRLVPSGDERPATLRTRRRRPGHGLAENPRLTCAGHAEDETEDSELPSRFPEWPRRIRIRSTHPIGIGANHWAIRNRETAAVSWPANPGPATLDRKPM
jgi:hypothetical protein